MAVAPGIVLLTGLVIDSTVIVYMEENLKVKELKHLETEGWPFFRQ